MYEATMSQNHNLESVVEKLIHEHFELDESLEEVIWFKSDATPKIRLLEINPDTFATGVVQSFSFPPLGRSALSFGDCRDHAGRMTKGSA